MCPIHELAGIVFKKISQWVFWGGIKLGLQYLINIKFIEIINV